MVFAKISQVAHYAPEQVVSNDDLAKIMETSDEFVLEPVFLDVIFLKMRQRVIWQRK